MFAAAVSFNIGIGRWNTAQVTNLEAIFSGASCFNQDISRWQIALVTSLEGVFNQAALGSGISFKNSNWDEETQGVTSLQNLFYGNAKFNGGA